MVKYTIIAILPEIQLITRCFAKWYDIKMNIIIIFLTYIYGKITYPFRRIIFIDLNIATIDFLANGGDQYPYRGAPFTKLGVTYQQALVNYIVDGLSALITAADYPEGGEGRITEQASELYFVDRLESSVLVYLPQLLK